MLSGAAVDLFVLAAAAFSYVCSNSRHTSHRQRRVHMVYCAELVGAAAGEFPCRIGAVTFKIALYLVGQQRMQLWSVHIPDLLHSGHWRSRKRLSCSAATVTASHSKICTSRPAMYACVIAAAFRQIGYLASATSTTRKIR